MAYYAAWLLFMGLAAWHALVRWRTER